jgi:hypothetical protein
MDNQPLKTLPKGSLGEAPRPNPEVEVKVEGNGATAGSPPASAKPNPSSAGDRRPADPERLDTRKVLAKGSYASSQVNLLVSKYARIRSDLKVVLQSDLSDEHCTYAERVADYLRDAKEALEGDHVEGSKHPESDHPKGNRPNLPAAALLLAGADRGLVWLLSRDILRQRCNLTLEQLRKLNPQPDALIGNLEVKFDPKEEGGASQSDEALRNALADALNYINELDWQDVVEEELQARRLSILMRYLSLVLLLLLAAIPFTTTAIRTPDIPEGRVIWPVLWPSYASDNDLTAAAFLVFAGLGLAAIGAAGGVISGMLKVRDSRASLTSYRTSLFKLALKPLVGAVAALVMYTLLSWNIIKGLEVTSPGVFVLAAFLAGFSERYFLRVVRAAENEPEHSESQVRADK